MRRFLPLLLLLSFPLAAGTAKDLEVTRLAEGVWALTWKAPLENPIEGNVLVVAGPDDVLLVDSSFLPSTARRLVGEIRKLTPKPVRWVVNTHWHNDHVQGNGVYRETWPGATFISHSATRQDALDHAFGKIPKGRADIEQAIATVQRWVAEGKDDSGKVIDEARKGRIDDYIAVMRTTLEETAAIETVVPGLTFENRLVLHQGTRRIELLHPGLGNTRGDVVVFLPAERIVATGDLVVHPEPFGFGSYYEEWVETLGRVAALEADTFVPGHGPVMRDRAYIEQLQGLFRALTAEVDAAVKKGLTLEETKKAVTLEEWKKRFAGEDEAIARAFDAFFVTPAVERAWKQATGAPDARDQGV